MALPGQPRTTIKDSFGDSKSGSVRQEALVQSDGEPLWIAAEYTPSSGDVSYFWSDDTTNTNPNKVRWQPVALPRVNTVIRDRFITITSKARFRKKHPLVQSFLHKESFPIQKGWLQKQPVKNG